MKSLAERKKQRAEQRAESLKESGAVNQDTGVVLDDVSTGDFDSMTIEQLKDAAKAMGTEVPKDKTLKEDILTFVKNLAAFQEQEKADAAETAGSGWKSGN